MGILNCSTSNGSPIMLATFNQFNVLWYHSCNQIIREQARSKASSKASLPFLPFGMVVLYHTTQEVARWMGK